MYLVFGGFKCYNYGNMYYKVIIRFYLIKKLMFDVIFFFEIKIDIYIMNYIYVYGVILYIKNNKLGIVVFMSICINNF